MRIRGFPSNVQTHYRNINRLLRAGHPEEEKYVSLVEAWKGKVRLGTSTKESALIDEYFPRPCTPQIVR